MKAKLRSALTFVEMVVVISLFSFILLIFVTSSDLIRSSEINAQYSQFIKYESAILNFVDSYKELPGDFSIAYQIWGSDCSVNSSDCNGNGDSVIGGLNQSRERNMAWLHLNLAKMIGSYYNGGTSVIAGETVPFGKISNSMITFPSNYNSDGSSTLNGYNTLYLVANDDSCVERPIFSSHDLYIIDKKFDDGLPTGKISAGENDSCDPILQGCYNSVQNQYINVSDSKNLRCFLSFATKFSFM